MENWYSPPPKLEKWYSPPHVRRGINEEKEEI